MINSLSKFVIALSIVLLAGGIEAAAQTHTPAVPPAPDCKPTNGSGTWVKGDIIPSSKSPSMGSACTQVYNCVVKPDKKPNEALQVHAEAYGRKECFWQVRQSGLQELCGLPAHC